jgi:muramoyltetrapeptide carboxypeptidase
METVKPPRLKRGDKVGFVSPSGSIKLRRKLLKKAIENFCDNFELEPTIGSFAFDYHFYASAPIEDRVEDIHSMFTDRKIRAVIWTLGGDAAVDLVDKLDYDLIKKNPKIFLGISDFTTLSNPIFKKTGLITFHGVELYNFADRSMDYTLNSINDVLFGAWSGQYEKNSNWRDFKNNKTKYSGWRTLKKGKAEGRILGGAYGGISVLSGTKYSPDFEDSILVVDFYMRHKRSIYRALKTLHLRGVFDKINGLIIGYTVGADDPEIKEGNEMDLKKLVAEATEGYNFPIMQIGEIGHYVENLILPIGAKCSMDATNLEFRLEEKVVS